LFTDYYHHYCLVVVLSFSFDGQIDFTTIRTSNSSEQPFLDAFVFVMIHVFAYETGVPVPNILRLPTATTIASATSIHYCLGFIRGDRRRSRREEVGCGCELVYPWRRRRRRRRKDVM
jgi:hypothetical protein